VTTPGERTPPSEDERAPSSRSPRRADNPYFHRGPILDPAYFFGRANELGAVAGLWRNAQCVAVTGPLKIGKTSFLLRLGRPDTQSAFGLAPDLHDVCYLTFEGTGDLTPEEWFHWAWTALTERGDRRSPFPGGTPGAAMPYQEFLNRVLDVGARGRRVTFLLDEVELAAQNPRFDIHFFSGLRHLASHPHVAFVTGSERSLHALDLGARRVGSPFADLFATVRLGLMSSDEAADLVTRLAARSGRRLHTEAAWFVELAGLHPFYLQLLGWLTVEYLDSERALSAGDRAYLRVAFADTAEPFLGYVWDSLSPAARHHLLQRTWSEDASAARELVDAAILQPDGAIMSGEVWGVFAERRLREEETAAKAYFAVERGGNIVREPAHGQIYATVRALVKALEARDFYMRGHADRVAHLASAIAAELGLAREQVEGVRIAGRLHDLGLLATGDLVLLKPETLTGSERRLVETHPLVGAQILEVLDFPWEVKPAVRHHHERMDGTGYPDGLVGDEIPLTARVLAVAEVFAAMTEDRVYRRARSTDDAMAHLLHDAGRKYDPAAVMALRRVLANNGSAEAAP